MTIDNTNNDILLISVKPQYAIKIFSGEKTIELRKSAPKKAGKNSYIIIYVTAPVKEIWGICKIENIITENPNSLWRNFGDKTGISESEFKNYYGENKKAFGIKLKDVSKLFKYSLKLDILKSLFPEFMPPQTYCYIDKNSIKYSKLKELILANQ